MIMHSTDLLYSIPEIVSGSELPESEMLMIASHKYPNKKYVILKHWMLIDIIDTSPKLKKTKSPTKTQTVVYYSLTERNLSGASQQDMMSYSDYQISYNDGFFETEKTVYLLMSKGFRKTASARLVSLLKDRTT
jgi:hypothetical protein